MSRVIIFDFDDTLVETTGVFNIARADFCKKMDDHSLLTLSTTLNRRPASLAATPTSETRPTTG